MSQIPLPGFEATEEAPKPKRTSKEQKEQDAIDRLVNEVLESCPSEEMRRAVVLHLKLRVTIDFLRKFFTQREQEEFLIRLTEAILEEAEQ